jgi:hypothetical protein
MRIRRAMRWTSTRALPEPGPASTVTPVRSRSLETVCPYAASPGRRR